MRTLLLNPPPMLDARHLHNANAASVLLFPHLAPLALARPRPGVPPAEVRCAKQATEWVESERHVFLAVIRKAAKGGFCPHSWQPPWTVGWFFHGDESWRALAAAQETAAEIAGRHRDLAGEALARHHLGWLRFWLGEEYEACRQLGRSVELVTTLSAGKFRMPRGLTPREARSGGRIPQALRMLGNACGFTGWRALRWSRRKGRCANAQGHRRRSYQDRNDITQART